MNTGGTVEDASYGSHPEVEMEDGPLADEHVRFGVGSRPAAARVDDPQEGFMSRDVTQVCIVTADQSVVDQRQPGKWFRADLIEQIRNRAVEESQELHALGRAATVARNGDCRRGRRR